MRKILTFLLRLIVGVLILGLLIYKINFSEVYHAMTSIEIYIWPLFLSALVLTLLASTINIRLVLTGLGQKISFFRLLKLNLISRSIGSFLPGKLGEVSLAYLLKKDGFDYGIGLLTILIDKIVTLILVCLFSVIAFFLFLGYGLALKLTLILAVLLIVFMICLLSEKVRLQIKKYILRKYSVLFSGFSKNLFLILRSKKTFIFANILVTLIMLVSLSTIIHGILYSLGSYTSLFYVLLIHSIGVLAAMLPISIGGIGTREAAMVYFYSVLNVNLANVLVIYLLFYFFNYLLSGIILFKYSSRLNYFLKDQK